MTPEGALKFLGTTPDIEKLRTIQKDSELVDKIMTSHDAALFYTSVTALPGEVLDNQWIKDEFTQVRNRLKRQILHGDAPRYYNCGDFGRGIDPYHK